MSPSEPATGLASDLHAIANLQRRFAELNDAARWHEVADLFLEDACFVRPSAPHRPIVGREAILRAFLARSAHAPRRHLVTQPVVGLLDGATARARCHSVLLTDAGDGQGTLAVGGFEDALRRTPEGWRFAARTGFTFIGPVPCAWPAAGLLAALDAWPSL